MSRPLSASRTRSGRGDTSLTIHIDGAARGNPGPAGAGAVLSGPKGKVLAELSVYLGPTTNNVAETMALILALQRALSLGCPRVSVFSDSELLTRQVNGDYRVRDPDLSRLHVLIRELISGFESFGIQHLPRARNKAADRLANRAVTDGLRRAPSSGRSRPAPPPAPDQMTLF